MAEEEVRDRPRPVLLLVDDGETESGEVGNDGETESGDAGNGGDTGSIEACFFEKQVGETAAGQAARVGEPEYEPFETLPVRGDESRKAMRATFAIMVLSLSVIGGLLVYHKLLMPEPVRLGAETGLFDRTEQSAFARPLPELTVTAPSARAGAGAGGERELERSGVAKSLNAAEPSDPGGANLPSDPGGAVSPSDPGGANLPSDPGGAVSPGDPGSSDHHDTEKLIELAGHYLEEGKNREAEGMALRAVAFDPTSSAGWITLGAARDGMRDKQGARKAYQRCAELGNGRFAHECRNLLR